MSENNNNNNNLFTQQIWQSHSKFSLIENNILQYVRGKLYDSLEFKLKNVNL